MLTWQAMEVSKASGASQARADDNEIDDFDFVMAKLRQQAGGSQVLEVGQAKALLRAQGPRGQQAASWLGSMSRLRNGRSHSKRELLLTEFDAIFGAGKAEQSVGAERAEPEEEASAPPASEAEVVDRVAELEKQLAEKAVQLDLATCKLHEMQTELAVQAVQLDLATNKLHETKSELAAQLVETIDEHRKEKEGFEERLRKSSAEGALALMADLWEEGVKRQGGLGGPRSKQLLTVLAAKHCEGHSFG